MTEIKMNETKAKWTQKYVSALYYSVSIHTCMINALNTIFDINQSKSDQQFVFELVVTPLNMHAESESKSSIYLRKNKTLKFLLE